LECALATAQAEVRAAQADAHVKRAGPALDRAWSRLQKRDFILARRNSLNNSVDGVSIPIKERPGVWDEHSLAESIESSSCCAWLTLALSSIGSFWKTPNFLFRQPRRRARLPTLQRHFLVSGCNMLQHDVCDCSHRQTNARAHATRKISSSSNGGDESNVLRSSSLQQNDVHIRIRHFQNIHFVVLTSSSVKVDLAFGATLVVVEKCSDSAQNEQVDAH
jgi:hypothetical protein